MQNFLPQYRTGYNPQQFYNLNSQQTMPIKTVTVTSKNEADNYIPDVSGTPTIFINRGNNEIYLKQMDLNTGLAIFKEYVEKQPVASPILNEKGQESTNIYKKDLKALNDKIDTLQKTFEDYIKADNTPTETKGGKNAK